MNTFTKVKLDSGKIKKFQRTRSTFTSTMSELLKTKMEEVYEKCTAIEEGFSKNAGKQFIRTPLMIAPRDGHVKCVEALIKQGADVNALDENSSTPLMRAADRGNVECVKALVTAGADPDASI